MTCKECVQTSFYFSIVGDQTWDLSQEVLTSALLTEHRLASNVRHPASVSLKLV